MATDLAAIIDRIGDGTWTTEDVAQVLEAYQPLTDKYLAILTGKLISSTGQPMMQDDNVRLFAYSFRRGGDVAKTLSWVIKRCEQFTFRELHAEVISSFLQCLVYKGWLKEFPSVLARNVAQLIGNPLEIPTAAHEGTIPDPSNKVLSTIIPEAEAMFRARGIVLSEKERLLIRLLSVNFNYTWAAQEMGVSRQRVHYLMKRLRRKASLQ